MALTNFLVHIDMNKNQLINGVYDNQSSAPAGAVDGQFYHNTTDHFTYFYNGSAWRVNVEGISASDGSMTMGGTDAVPTVMIATGGVSTGKIADSAVTTGKINDSAVTTGKINAGAVTTAKIAAGAVTTTEIADDAVTTTKILNSNVTTAKIADSNVTTAKIADSNVTTGKLNDLAVTTGKLDDLAVTTGKLGASAVTTAKIADSNVTTGKIADDAVTTVKILDSNVTAGKIAADAVTTVKILDSNVTTAKIADSNVTTAKINDSAVTTAKINAGAVTTAKIATGAVTATELADDAVTTVKILNSNVTTAKINDDAVTTAKIADSNVTTAKLADNAVTSGKIAMQAVTTSELGESAVTTAKIADSNVTEAKLAFTVVRADGANAFSADQSMGGFKLTNLGTPTLSGDAANKGYVDGLANGLDFKGSVRLATTANLAATRSGAVLTATGNGALSVDGVTAVSGNRILVKNQSTGADNGIYTVTTVGNVGTAFVLTRASDATTGTLTAGAFAFVEEGTQADTGWVLATDEDITVNTTSLSFVQFSAAGQIDAGAGLTQSGLTLNVGAGTGITVNANDVQISASYVGQSSITTLGTITTGTWNGTTIALANGGTGATSAADARTNLNVPTRYSGNITGDATTTSFTVTHGMGTRDCIVQVREVASPYAYIGVLVEAATTNTSVITFQSPPADGTVYRATVMA